MTQVATATKTQLQVDRWQKLTDNVWKTDLGTAEPEILLLQLSNEQFNIFRSSEAAARAYLDQYLKVKSNGCAFQSITPQADSDDDWIVVPIHTPDSMIHLNAWQCGG